MSENILEMVAKTIGDSVKECISVEVEPLRKEMAVLKSRLKKLENKDDS